MPLSPQRDGRLTASEHAAALSLNPYCSRQELWRKWNGLAEPPSPATLERFKWGHDNAPNAVAHYEAETGEIVLHCLDREVFIPYSDWSGATPDGWVGSVGLLETKCPTRLWDKPPDYYWVQVQSQLAITHLDWCDLCAWTPEGSAIWRTQRSPEYWPWAEPLLRKCYETLTTGLEPKRAKKPKLPVEIRWERIA